MSKLTVPNWFGDIVSHPLVVVEAKTVRGIARILRDTAKYPSPVRAVGSNHSTAACSVADGGTMIKMLGMDRILEVTDETVTVEAGAILVDVAQELKKRNLQFYVNTEIGNLSMGSAACAGTKDGSMPGEFGQVSSYCTRMKMVLPSGKILEASEESDPELMKVLRCSYGTFGIVTEATFRIDMESLTVADLEGDMANLLVKHLASDDFFSVGVHKHAVFALTSVSPIDGATPGAPNFNASGTHGPC